MAKDIGKGNTALTPFQTVTNLIYNNCTYQYETCLDGLHPNTSAFHLHL